MTEKVPLKRILTRMCKSPVVIIRTNPGVSCATQVCAAVADKWPGERVYLARLHYFGVLSSRAQLGRYDQQMWALTSAALVNRIVSGRQLPAGTIIIDETHERDIYTNLLIGLVAHFKSKDTRVVIVTETKADADRMSAFFDDAPVITTVSGPRHQVTEEVVYLKPYEHHTEGVIRTVLSVMKQFLAGGLTTAHSGKVRSGSVAVLVPGRDDIVNVVQALGQLTRGESRIETVICYGASQPNDLAALSKPPAKGVLRFVIGTEVLRSSVVVANLVGAIDSGEVKRTRAESSGGERLQKVPVTRADVERMMGRIAARYPGFYFLMSGGMDQGDITEHPTAEVESGQLLRALIRLAVAGLDPQGFRYFRAPPEEKLAEAISKLRCWGALDEEGRVTPSGANMFRLPLEPKLAATFLPALKLGVLPEAIIVAAALKENGFYALPVHRESVRVNEEALRRLLSYVAESSSGWYVLDSPRSGAVSLERLPSWIERKGGHYLVHCGHHDFPLSRGARWVLEVARSKWRVADNGFATIVSAYRAFQRAEKEIGDSQLLRGWCDENGLDLDRLRAVESIISQIQKVLAVTSEEERDYSPDNLTRALLYGLFDQVGVRIYGQHFGGAHGDFQMPSGFGGDIALTWTLHRVPLGMNESAIMPWYAAPVKLSWLEEVGVFGFSIGGVITRVCEVTLFGERVGSVDVDGDGLPPTSTENGALSA